MKALDYIYNKLNIILRGVKIGKKARINGRILFKGKKNIIIGENCKLNSGPRTNPLTGFLFCSIGADKNGKVIIGNNVGISNSSIYSQNKIIIHDNVNIGNSTTILDTDFHSIDYKLRDDYNSVKRAPIVIKNNAWIGCNCIVLKGVTIGENSIVSAGSVVTKSIPDNEIWGGNPAKFLKKINE